MISFELSSEEQLLQETARAFAAERLWPHIRAHESARGIPREIVAEAHELGLRSVDVPSDAGGAGLGLLPALLVEEELAYGDPAACFALGGPGALAAFLLELGSAAQRKEVFSRFTTASAAVLRGAVAWTEPSSAEAGAMPALSFATRARKEGHSWILDGDKSLVAAGGSADVYLVFASIDGVEGGPAVGAFLVDAAADGVEVLHRVRTLGLDAANVAGLRLRGVRVDDRARLSGGDDVWAGMTRAVARLALLNAARAVGLARRAFDLAHAYAGERKAFGKPIGHFQAIAFTLADRLMEVDGARWLLWRAGSSWDRTGKPDLVACAAAAASASEAALRTANDAVQLFGGAGFIRDVPVEKLLRDARQLALFGPSVATLDQILADTELGLPFDPAALLPMSDLQPVIL